LTLGNLSRDTVIISERRLDNYLAHILSRYQSGWVVGEGEASGLAHALPVSPLLEE